MRMHIAVAGLILAIGATAWQSPRLVRAELTAALSQPQRPTAPAQPPAAPLSATTPPSSPPAAEEAVEGICESPSWRQPHEIQQGRRQRLLHALAAALQGVSITAAPQVVARTGSCLAASPVKGSGGQILWVCVRPKDFCKDMVAVWHVDGAWRAGRLPIDEFNTIPYPMYYRDTPAGAEVVALGRNGGSAHAGSYSLIRFGAELKVLWQTPLYDHLFDRSVSDHLLVATYRDRKVYDESHVFWPNCCRPINGQTIWERQGDTFVEKAVRVYPSPLRATSAFVGALNAGRLDLAAVYAQNAGVVKAMAGEAGQPPVIDLGPKPANLWPTEDAEEAYWDALPPEHRGPKPALTEFVWPATPRPLLLRRIDGQWKVAGWQCDGDDTLAAGCAPTARSARRHPV